LSRLDDDLALVLLFIAGTVAFVLILPNEVLRIIVGIPMVLFIPGYALIAALFPGKGDLDGIERVALSFGLSIAIVPLVGLALNFTPFGISAITLLLTYIAHWRRQRLAQEARFSVSFRAWYDAIRNMELGESRLDRALTVILAISILLSVAMLVYVIVTPKQGEKFTEFYILGPGGKAAGYPTNFTIGKPETVIIGVVNHEYSAVNYTVNVRIRNETLNEIGIALAHNATWEKPVNITMAKPAGMEKLEFLLYRENLSEPYRDLHLFVNAT